MESLFLFCKNLYFLWVSCIFIHVMTNIELIDFIDKNKENYGIQLKRHHRSFYDLVDGLYSFKTFGQKVYHYLNGDGLGKCEVCGESSKFDSFYKGYRRRCSYDCLGTSKFGKSHEVRQCVICESEFEFYKKKKKTTCSSVCLLKLNSSEGVNVKRQKSLRSSMVEKYGVDHNSKLPDFRKKVKQTKLERHGSENYVNIDKVRKTKLERYGDENYTNVEKARETKSQKYGDPMYNNRDKFIETNLRLYGVEYPMQNSDISDKAMATFDVKYGGIGFSSPDIKNRIETTNLKKFGHKVASKNKSVSDSIQTTAHDTFFSSMVSGSRLGDEVSAVFLRDGYVGTRGPNDEQIFYKFKCHLCNTIFDACIEDGRVPVCLTCHPKEYAVSKYETEIFEFVNALLPKIDILRNVRNVIKPFELDVYIPERKLAIEFDGVVWHSELFGCKNKRYHLNKTELCKNLGIKLIHIFENEWVHKSDIVKSRLMHALGVNKSDRIYARECVIKEVTPFIKNQFLQQHHIQGSDRSSILIGSYYKDELVAIMTFGSLRVALGNKESVDGEYEMYRFCVNRSVVGIASKMLSYFIKKHGPKKIITFADRRFSDDSAFYGKLGFKFIKYTPPNYYYFFMKQPLLLHHRYGFRKDQLDKKLEKFEPSLSEWQNMQLNGYDRIWDCGHLKFEWNKS